MDTEAGGPIKDLKKREGENYTDMIGRLLELIAPPEIRCGRASRAQVFGRGLTINHEFQIVQQVVQK
jgi:hypothetical protein